MRRQRAFSHAARALATAGLTGCMPWVAPPGAHVAPPGRFEPGLGLAALVAPDEPGEPVPVPQAWLRFGLARRLDVGAAYAAPMTGIIDVRGQVVDRTRTAVAVGLGAGVHAFPDLGGLGEAIALPVGTAYVAAEHAGPTRSVHGFARAWLPAYLESEPRAAVVWGQFGVGAEWARGRLGHGPQLGFVVPSTGIGDVVLVLAVPAPDAVPSLKGAGLVIVTNAYPHNWTWHLSRIEGSPWNDVRVRKALAMSIDREQIVKNVTKGEQIPAYSLNPVDPNGYQPITGVKYDIDKAKQLLAAAGFPHA